MASESYERFSSCDSSFLVFRALIETNLWFQAEVDTLEESVSQLIEEFVSLQEDNVCLFYEYQDLKIDYDLLLPLLEEKNASIQEL